MQDGKIRALAVGDQRRLPQLSEVPTMIELGVSDDPLIPNFFGLAAPNGTPSVIIERLNATMAKAIKSADIAAKLESSGLVAAPSSAAAMASLVNEDIERFGRLIRDLDIKIVE